jgi:hypothetical protein
LRSEPAATEGESAIAQLVKKKGGGGTSSAAPNKPAPKKGSGTAVASETGSRKRGQTTQVATRDARTVRNLVSEAIKSDRATSRREVAHVAVGERTARGDRVTVDTVTPGGQHEVLSGILTDSGKLTLAAGRDRKRADTARDFMREQGYRNLKSAGLSPSGKSELFSGTNRGASRQVEISLATGKPRWSRTASEAPDAEASVAEAAPEPASRPRSRAGRRGQSTAPAEPVAPPEPAPIAAEAEAAPAQSETPGSRRLRTIVADHLKDDALAQRGAVVRRVRAIGENRRGLVVAYQRALPDGQTGVRTGTLTRDGKELWHSAKQQQRDMDRSTRALEAFANRGFGDVFSVGLSRSGKSELFLGRNEQSGEVRRLEMSVRNNRMRWSPASLTADLGEPAAEPIPPAAHAPTQTRIAQFGTRLGRWFRSFFDMFAPYE